MDFYQGVVVEYLRADRAVFVNTECCIQLNDAPNPDASGPHWYCDAVAVDLRNETVFLCEISFAERLGALLDRLKQWSEDWPEVRAALVRDCKVPATWPVRPWLFVPEASIERLVGKIEQTNAANCFAVFEPRITPLECVQPWQYRSWNHQDKDTKRPDSVPAAMRL
jgi:hypothetical protein